MNAKAKHRRQFNNAARKMLRVLVRVKDRIRERWCLLPVLRECEAEGVLQLLDELINAIIEDIDVSDARAASMLAAIGIFLDSTHWPEPVSPWEGD